MIALFQQASPTIDAGYQVILHFFVNAFDTLRNAWLEGVVVVLAVHFFLHQSKHRLGCESKSEKQQPRHRTERIQRPATASRSGGRALDSVISKQGGRTKSQDAQKVQRLVVSLLGQGSRCTAEALEQYEDLVRSRRTDLKRHIPDEQNARSMYIALIGCVASSPAAALPDSLASSSSGAVSHYSLGPRGWISRLLADMRSFGFLRTVEFYASVQKSLINNRLFHDALWLYEVMLDDTIHPNINMYICFMNTAIACNSNDKALFFFTEVSKLGPPSLRTYMTVLRVYTKNKDWKKAVELLDLIQASGTSPDNLVLNNVLGLCISAGQVTIAENLLFRWKDLVDVISCNIILKGCAQQADLTRSEEILDQMISQGPAPNLITFNTIMDCAVRALQELSTNSKHSHLRSGSPSNDEEDSFSCSISAASGTGMDSGDGKLVMRISRRPWDLLDRLLKLGLEPDRYTCSTLVKGMHLAGCSVADIDRAVELLYRIGREALQFQGASTGSSQGCNARLLEVLFNTLLDACISVRDLDRMGEIFEMMQAFGVSVSAVTYGTLIKAFGQAGRIGRCREVWAEMQDAKVHPTIVTYGCYIDACIRNEDIAQAEETFRSMSASSVRPNAVIYTSLIRGFAHAKQPGKALDAYRRMREEGIEATSVTFNSVLDIVARQLAEPNMLQEVLDDMRGANISPDVVTYSILIKASCSAGKLQNALSLFKQIRSHGLVFDQVAFNTLLLACSKAEHISDAEEIFQEMRSLGMTPTHVTASIMIKMYGKAKMLDKAIALSDLMVHDYGKKPNLFVYTCLIQACAQNKHVRRSWDIFNKMMQAGIEPDAITYGTVIHGCVYLNKFDHAMSLVRHAYMRASPEGIELDAQFATDAISLKKPVPLQQDVMQMLLSALRRKEQSALASELETIMSESAMVGSNVSAPQTKRSRGAGRRHGSLNEEY